MQVDLNKKEILQVITSRLKLNRDGRQKLTFSEENSQQVFK